MGDYNPHAPYILGQELVPIQDIDLIFNPNVNSVEYGTTFRLESDTQLNLARFYVNAPIAQPAVRQCGLIGVYPLQLAGKSGPVKQVIIPCVSASVTGNTSLSGASSVTDALYNPSDSGAVQFNYNGSNTQYLAAFFNTSAYPQLAGKRILNVSLIYTGVMIDASPDNTSTAVQIAFVNPQPGTLVPTVVEQVDDAGRFVQFLSPTLVSNTGALILETSFNNASNSPVFSEETETLNIGDVNNFWQPGVDPNVSQRTNLPWTYDDLLKFESSANTSIRQRIRVSIALPATAGTAVWNQFPLMQLRYLAMKVTYCEETRVAYGAREYRYNIGANAIPLYNLSRSTNPVLPKGEYVATLSFVDTGETDFGANVNGQFPPLNAIRDLYTIPSHVGKQLNVPYPLDDSVVGKQFSVSDTHILPQVSLHASGSTAAILDPQVYGRQAAGQVYGSFTVTQEVHDGLAGGVGTWPWIRFYARRYGVTTVPLSVAVAGGSAYITPEEFDELEQITTDNWREVTLELSPAPSMGGGSTPQIVWSATGEQAGNRWEVLGAAAPAVSGVAGSLVTQVPSTQRLGPATYGQPVSGSVINMAWLPQLGPYVTGTTDDQSADVSFLLSQSPPAVTGLTATWLSQAVTGIGQNCGIDPCCVPSEIYYLQLAWNQSDDPVSLKDVFDRSETGTWGSPDYGPSYVALNSSSALNVTNDEGLIEHTTMGTDPEGAVVPIPTANFDVTAMLRNESGGTIRAGIMGRYVVNDFYEAYVEVSSATSISLVLRKTVASVATELSRYNITAVSSITNGIGSAVMMRFMASDSNLKVKCWAPGAIEPVSWLIETTDSSITTDAGYMAFFLETLSGSSATLAVSNVEITPPRYWFGSYELQRRDTVEEEWQTIMKATNPAVMSFNDFEGRPGIVSEYRIRTSNVYDFHGEWSLAVSGMVPAPGVYGGCLSNGHILIFTTNEHQNGSSNLAYASVWLDQQVEENFSFPEAGFVQMQAMYNRDFYIAFRPLERGGEQFQRTVLVQAAAIAPETLADFTSLRNLAWSDVNYVCVRDEDGNRWFAHIGVPSGNVLRNRKLYLAPVQVTEVSATPTPVDPSPWF